MRFPSALLGVLVPVGDAIDGDLVETADPAIGDITLGAAECAPSGPDAAGSDPAVAGSLTVLPTPVRDSQPAETALYQHVNAENDPAPGGFTHDAA